MTGTELVTRALTKDMRIVEVATCNDRLLPRSAGWNTVVVERAHRSGDAPEGSREAADFFWRDGSLTDAIPAGLHGTFDGLVARDVAEHVPDLIGFLLAVAKLLKPSGSLVLALPDKRFGAGLFQPATTTGALLDARGRTKPRAGAMFDHVAHVLERDVAGAGVDGGPRAPLRLLNTLEQAGSLLGPGPERAPAEGHEWRFTPASFELLILELNLLGTIPWAIERLERGDAAEFAVWLQQRAVRLPSGAAATRRLVLLRETVLETKQQVARLEPAIRPPAVSAVIPLYNGGRFIEAALLSVFAQTLPPQEVIVVDDGSTDDGPAIVRATAGHYPIRLLSKPNGGQSSARNLGIAHSSGELIALLDQDDIWYPTHLEYLAKRFVELSDAGEPGWVYSDVDRIDSDGQMICRAVLATLPTEHPKRSLFACLREDMFVLPSTSLISRKAFDAVAGFDESLSGYEDDDLFLRLFRAGYTNAFIETPLAGWRSDSGSSSHGFRMRRSRSIFMRKLLAEYADDPTRDLYFQRDLLLPRFYRTAVVEYRTALASGDSGRIRDAHDELTFIVDRIPSRRRILGRFLNMARSQQAARLAYAARFLARPLLRRLV